MEHAVHTTTPGAGTPDVAATTKPSRRPPIDPGGSVAHAGPTSNAALPALPSLRLCPLLGILTLPLAEQDAPTREGRHFLWWQCPLHDAQGRVPGAVDYDAASLDWHTETPGTVEMHILGAQVTIAVGKHAGRRATVMQQVADGLLVRRDGQHGWSWYRPEDIRL